MIMRSLARWCTISLLLPTLALAQTNYPDDYDSSDDLPTVATGHTIASGAANTIRDALFALQRAIGAHSTLSTQSVLDRLDLKVDTTDLEDLNPKVLNSVLNASAYAGADIGAKINAAVADCTTQLGSSLAYCRVIVPPGVYSLSTAIKISRAHTQLDCQNALLVPASGFTDAPIRLNYDTIGVQADPVLNLSVHNCHVLGSAQTSMSTVVSGDTGDDGNPRMGALVAWNVQNIDIENVTIGDSLGPGVTILNSWGRASRLTVSTTRVPFSGGNAAGVYVSGVGYGAGVDGRPLYVTGVHVDTSATYGVWAKVGAVLRDLDIDGTDSACLALGGAEPQGWISVSGFTFTDCAQDVTGSTGSIDDLPATEVSPEPLRYVNIGPGTIRRSPSDGILLGRTQEYEHISIHGVTIECWGSGFTASRGILLQHGGVDYVVRGNQIAHPSGCTAQASNARGIEVRGESAQTVVDHNTISNGTFGILLSNAPGALARVAVRGNFIQETSNSPVWLNFSAEDNVDIEVSGNHFADVCTDGSTCGMVLLQVGAAGDVDRLTITNNVARLGGATMYGLEANVAVDNTATQTIYANNFFYSVANDDHNLIDTGADSIADDLRVGTVLTGEEFGGPGVFARLTAESGPNISEGDVICINADTSIGQCEDTDPADAIIGVAVTSIDDTEAGYVQTSGLYPRVRCTGTVSPGDLVIREDVGRVEASGSPGAGEALGKAVTACSGGRAGILIGVH